MQITLLANFTDDGTHAKKKPEMLSFSVTRKRRKSPPVGYRSTAVSRSFCSLKRVTRRNTKIRNRTVVYALRDKSVFKFTCMARPFELS